jgi:hypothetical protein
MAAITSSEESILRFVPSLACSTSSSLPRKRLRLGPAGSTGIGAQNPTVLEPGSATFLVRCDVLTKLIQTGRYAVLWTVLGNKEHIAPHRAPRIEDDHHATAGWLDQISPGPQTRHDCGASLAAGRRIEPPTTLPLAAPGRSIHRLSHGRRRCWTTWMGTAGMLQAQVSLAWVTSTQPGQPEE